MEKEKPKHVCDGCEHCQERVNGKFCKRMQIVTEYALRKPCESSPLLFA